MLELSMENFCLGYSLLVDIFIILKRQHITQNLLYINMIGKCLLAILWG